MSYPVTLSTVENYARFDLSNSSGATVENKRPIPKGERFSFIIPITAQLHHIWIAAGAFVQDTTTQWFVQGCLCFYSFGTKVGELLFSDASRSLSLAQREHASRPVLRIAADGSGSSMPVIRYQETDAVFERNNLDITAMTIRCKANEIKYIVEASYSNVPNLNTLRILIGARIISMA